jgi:tetratricopeptide (TPR) repeat protein
MLGQAALNAGKVLFQLGNLFGIKLLAGLGASWMKRAMQMAPRLSEGLLGRQEAALRELLRQFREGKLDEALRRALPLGDNGTRGGTPYTGQELPYHSLFYSLSNLLGGSGRGPAPIWYGGADVQTELAREYRHAAEQAVRKGDYRRAAFIYGKLLADYRMAANVLMQGCLFHDAALIYLSKLDDRRAAARAFEAAGEIDRAVELYRRLGEHVLAGDAFRRAGEEELAFLEYRQAAEKMAATGNYLGAGELMAGKAERPALAREYYREGWQRRPQGTPIACALALAKMHSAEREFPALRELVGEARQHFERPGDETLAERFFNDIALLADRPHLAEVRDELRDQALLGLAVKLRQRAAIERRPGNAVSTLFGRAGVWPVAAVHDADHAFRDVFQQPVRELADRPLARVRLGVGRVTAACHAPMTGDIFVGFLSGDVVCFRPATGKVLPVKGGDGMHVLSLATSSHGEVLCVLQTNDSSSRLRCYARMTDGTFTPFDHVEESFAPGKGMLTPQLAEADYVVGLLAEDEFQVRHVVSNRRDRPNLHVQVGDLQAALLIPGLFPASVQTALVLLQRDCVICYPSVGTEDFYTAALGWTPSIKDGSTLLTAPLSWLLYANDLELAGIDDGVLNWSRLHFGETRMEVVARSTAPRTQRTNFTAAALVRPSLVAGVSPERVEWLRAGATHLTVWEITTASLPQAVACFASAATGELLVIGQDGVLVRIPLPQG